MVVGEEGVWKGGVVTGVVGRCGERVSVPAGIERVYSSVQY